MARRRTPFLTDAELPIMAILWRRGEATVREVHESHPDSPAYNTVLTVLRILEEKGYVDHENRGRAHVYRPLLQQEEARGHALRHLVGRFFGGSVPALVLNLVETEALDGDEIRRIRELLDEAEKGQ